MVTSKRPNIRLALKIEEGVDEITDREDKNILIVTMAARIGNSPMDRVRVEARRFLLSKLHLRTISHGL